MKTCLRNKNMVILLGLAFTMLFYGFATRIASAATVSSNGPTLVDVNTSTTFTVSVIAQDVVGLYGWEFILRWAPGVVNCTDQTLNLDIWGSGNYLGPWVTTPINNVAGTYHQSITGRIPGTPQDGTFWLANLTFLVVATTFPQMTDFNVTKAPGYTAFVLLDFEANEIQHDTVNLSTEIIPEFLQVYLLPLLMLLSASSIIMAKLIRKRS